MIDGNFLLQSLSLERLAKCLDENPSFKGYLRGYIAEEKLRDHLSSVIGVSEVTKIPDRSIRKGDFSFLYKGESITVELKSLSSHNVRPDIITGGVVGSVSIKRTDSKVTEDGIKTSCLDRNEFDILAICTVSIDGVWSFKFIGNKYIPSSNISANFLTSTFTLNTVTTPFLRDNILEVLEDLG